MNICYIPSKLQQIQVKANDKTQWFLNVDSPISWLSPWRIIHPAYRVETAYGYSGPEVELFICLFGFLLTSVWKRPEGRRHIEHNFVVWGGPEGRPWIGLPPLRFTCLCPCRHRPRPWAAPPCSSIQHNSSPNSASFKSRTTRAVTCGSGAPQTPLLPSPAPHWGSLRKTSGLNGGCPKYPIKTRGPWLLCNMCNYLLRFTVNILLTSC